MGCCYSRECFNSAESPQPTFYHKGAAGQHSQHTGYNQAIPAQSVQNTDRPTEDELANKEQELIDSLEKTPLEALIPYLLNPKQIKKLRVKHKLLEDPMMIQSAVAYQIYQLTKSGQDQFQEHLMPSLLDNLIETMLNSALNGSVWSGYCLCKVTKLTKTPILLQDDYLKKLYSALINPNTAIRLFALKTLNYYFPEPELRAQISSWQIGKILQAMSDNIVVHNHPILLNEQLKCVLVYIKSAGADYVRGELLQIGMGTKVQILELQIPLLQDHVDFEKYHQSIEEKVKELKELLQVESLDNASLYRTISRFNLRDLITFLRIFNVIEPVSAGSWLEDPSSISSLAASQIASRVKFNQETIPPELFPDLKENLYYAIGNGNPIDQIWAAFCLRKIVLKYRMLMYEMTDPEVQTTSEAMKTQNFYLTVLLWKVLQKYFKSAVLFKWTEGGSNLQNIEVALTLMHEDSENEHLLKFPDSHLMQQAIYLQASADSEPNSEITDLLAHPKFLRVRLKFLSSLLKRDQRKSAQKLMTLFMFYKSLDKLKGRVGELKQTEHDKVQPLVKKLDERYDIHRYIKYLTPSQLLYFFSHSDSITPKDKKKPTLPVPDTRRALAIYQLNSHTKDKPQNVQPIYDQLIDHLIQTIQNGNPSEKCWAAYALGNLADSPQHSRIIEGDNLNIIKRALEEQDEMVKMLLFRLLQKISQQDPTNIKRIDDVQGNSKEIWKQGFKNLGLYTSPRNLKNNLSKAIQLLSIIDPNVRKEFFSALDNQVDFSDLLNTLDQSQNKFQHSNQNTELQYKLNKSLSNFRIMVDRLLKTPQELFAENVDQFGFIDLIPYMPDQTQIKPHAIGHDYLDDPQTVSGLALARMIALLPSVTSQLPDDLVEKIHNNLRDIIQNSDDNTKAWAVNLYKKMLKHYELGVSDYPLLLANLQNSDEGIRANSAEALNRISEEKPDGNIVSQDPEVPKQLFKGLKNWEDPSLLKKYLKSLNSLLEKNQNLPKTLQEINKDVNVKELEEEFDLNLGKMKGHNKWKKSGKPVRSQRDKMHRHLDDNLYARQLGEIAPENIEVEKDQGQQAEVPDQNNGLQVNLDFEYDSSQQAEAQNSEQLEDKPSYEDWFTQNYDNMSLEDLIQQLDNKTPLNQAIEQRVEPYDPPKSVQALAAYQIPKLFPVPKPLLPVLLDKLNDAIVDGDENAKAYAQNCLNALMSELSPEELRDLLLSKENGKLSSWIPLLLNESDIEPFNVGEKIQDPNTIQSLAAYIIREYLKDNPEEAGHHPDLIPNLYKCLESPKQNSQLWSAYCLDLIAKKSKPEALLQEQYLYPLSNALSSDNDNIKTLAVDIIGKTCQEHPALINHIRDFEINRIPNQLISDLESLNKPKSIHTYLKNLLLLLTTGTDIDKYDNAQLFKNLSMPRALESLKANLEQVEQAEDWGKYGEKIQNSIDQLDKILESDIKTPKGVKGLLNQTDAFVLIAKGLTLEDLIRQLPNQVPLRARYKNETWAEIPKTRGSFSAATITDYLSQRDYPDHCREDGTLECIKRMNAVGLLINGLFSTQLDRREIFAITLNNILQADDPELVAPLLEEPFVLRLADLMSTFEKEEMGITLSNLVDSICGKKPDIVRRLIAIDDFVIGSRMLEIMQRIQTKQHLFEHLHNFRDLYVDEEDNIVEDIRNNLLEFEADRIIDEVINQAPRMSKDGFVQDQSEIDELFEVLREELIEIEE